MVACTWGRFGSKKARFRPICRGTRRLTANSGGFTLEFDQFQTVHSGSRQGSRSRAGHPCRPVRGGAQMAAVSMTVNGKPVTGDIEPRTLLVQFLRENSAPHRHPCRLRHRASAAPASSISTGTRSRPAPSCAVQCEGAQVTHDRGARATAPTYTPSRPPSAITTACNAASARRA